MKIKNNILKEEMEFPKLFSNYIEKDYGMLFYDENNKESHDSNHAVLYVEKVSDIEKIVTEIRDFYLEKKITPYIYQPYQKGYFNDHRQIFEQLGFGIKMFGNSKFMVLSEKNTLTKNSDLNIKRITKWDERIATDIYLPNGEDYAIEVEKKSLNNEDYYLFTGFLGDIMVCMTSFHRSKLYNCTRFDYIITAKNYRNKGYARDVLGYVVDFCNEMKFPNCFQWPANDTSERISTAAGFRVMFEEEAGAATYLMWRK